MRKATLVLLSLLIAATASAVQYVIPAAGNAVGVSDSVWQSDVTFHNVGFDVATLTLEYHDFEGLQATQTITLAPHQTMTLENIVENTFGLTETLGAITISGEEFAARKVAITSRTYNLSPEGEFGQDIPALKVDAAAIEGDTAVINGPANPDAARFNFGIYALEATEIQWVLIREDGEIAIDTEESYEAGMHIQYNQGVSSFLGSESQENDVVYARVLEGSAVFYGSIVNRETGDPSYVPYHATRENFAAQLVGVDLNEDGVVDIFDADHDGVLDEPVRLSTSGFPNFFRVVVVDPEGNEVSLELAEASNGVQFVGDGLIQWAPSSQLRGTSGELRVIATDGFATSEFLIPVSFR